MLFQAEMTDTFGGEAPASTRTLLKRVKDALNTRGIRHRTITDYGDTLRADAVGACIRLFVMPVEV